MDFLGKVLTFFVTRNHGVFRRPSDKAGRISGGGRSDIITPAGAGFGGPEVGL